MNDRRRIEQPPVDIDSITTKISEAKELALIPQEQKIEALIELYDADSETDSQEYLMQDIVLSKMTDVRSLPTAKTTKTAIYDEYCYITGKSRRSAERYFKKAQRRIKEIHNIGMVTHHAAAVAQDVVSKMYADLDKLDQQQKDWEEQIEDLDPNVEEDKKKINYFEGKISNNISRKNKLYEQLMNYGKEFGVNLSIKSNQNTINEQKNQILAQKFDNDAAWQKADVAIRYKDMSPEDKKRALIQAISSDKGIVETVESTFLVKDITNE